MLSNPNEHTSEALRQIGHSTVLMCWIAGISILLQVLVWSFVNFTDLRYTQIETTAGLTNPEIVYNQPQYTQKQNASTGNTNEQKPPVDANRVYSKYDYWFSNVHKLALLSGLLSIIILTINTCIGVVVASAGQVNGVSKVVAAQTWSMILLLLVFPWSIFGNLLKDLPFNGILLTYSKMCLESSIFQNSDAAFSASFIYYIQNLVLPLACIIAIMLINIWFKSGIKGGIISRGPSAFEIAIDREATGQTATSLFSTGRTRGALNSTISQSNIPDSISSFADDSNFTVDQTPKLPTGSKMATSNANRDPRLGGDESSHSIAHKIYNEKSVSAKSSPAPDEQKSPALRRPI